MNGLIARAVLVSALSAATAIAPCATPWLPGSGIVGANGGVVTALAGMPNGDLVVAGSFTSAGGARLRLTLTRACEAQLALPNTQALAGIAVHQQMVPFEVDPALNVIAVTATNAIAATIGSF